MEFNIIFLAILISFLWGIQPVINKYLLERMDGITIMFITSIIYTICLLITGVFNYEIIIKDINNMNTNDYMWIIIITFFCIFVTNIIYYYILKDNKTSVISTLICISPIFTLIVAYFYINEQINIYAIIGILLTIIGVILILNNDDLITEEKFISKYD